ncbi:MAG: hypothetical protein LKG73_13545, partial [Acetobacter sp.]|nr:hypothetical protein [Acetobacter sp.]
MLCSTAFARVASVVTALAAPDAIVMAVVSFPAWSATVFCRPVTPFSTVFSRATACAPVVSLSSWAEDASPATGAITRPLLSRAATPPADPTFETGTAEAASVCAAAAAAALLCSAAFARVASVVTALAAPDAIVVAVVSFPAWSATV